jgi:hypothetical protein
MPTRLWFAPPLLAAALWLSGCGYVGDPMPPSLAIPSPIADLHAFERGDKLIVDFTAPALATDEAPLRRLRDVELQIGGQLVKSGAQEAGPVHLEIPVAPWVGQEVSVAARAVSRKGRAGDWSNQVRLRVIAPLDTPSDLKAEGTQRGVEVRWPAPERAGVAWRVLRQGPGQPKPELVGVAEKPVYLDSAAEYGAKYEYVVQAVMKAGDAEAESEWSRPAAIEFEDRFPPATPSGLSALAGLDSVQLTWNPDGEADLRGYYLYRAGGDGPFARVGGALDAPTYTDRAVVAGRRYRYAVSAVDQKGNESARSEAAETTAQ